MLPHQRKKVDLNAMTEEERKLFRLYGKLPSKTDILKNKLKERKYFDSGDYALSKAGKASAVGVTNIGSQHPLPENIPHHNTPKPAEQTAVNSNGNSISPVKESSHLLLHSKSPIASEEPITSDQNEPANDEEKAEAKEEPSPEGKADEGAGKGDDNEAVSGTAAAVASTAPVPVSSQG